jgi:hypothetical protein
MESACTDRQRVGGWGVWIKCSSCWNKCFWINWEVVVVTFGSVRLLLLSVSWSWFRELCVRRCLQFVETLFRKLLLCCLHFVWTSFEKLLLPCLQFAKDSSVKRQSASQVSRAYLNVSRQSASLGQLERLKTWVRRAVFLTWPRTAGALLYFIDRREKGNTT